MSRSQRLAFAAIAAVIAVVAVVVLASGSDEEQTATTPTQAATPQSQVEESATATSEPDEAEPRETPEPEETQIEIRGGEVVGGVQEIRAKEGDEVRFAVTSDAPAHVHLHGYDVVRDAAPGKPARFNIDADIVGIFEVELEDTHVQVASLRVEQ